MPLSEKCKHFKKFHSIQKILRLRVHLLFQLVGVAISETLPI